MSTTEIPRVTLAPVEELAKIARWAVERDDWDMIHELVTLEWREAGGELRLVPGTIALLAGDIDPRDYPRLMDALVINELKTRAAGECSAVAPCALMLVIEGYGVMEPKPDASDAEKEVFRRDRFERNFSARADSRELKMAAVADLTGRLVTASKDRETGLVDELQQEPGTVISGRLPVALTRAATALGDALKTAGLWDGEG